MYQDGAGGGRGGGGGGGGISSTVHERKKIEDHGSRIYFPESRK